MPQTELAWIEAKGADTQESRRRIMLQLPE